MESSEDSGKPQGKDKKRSPDADQSDVDPPGERPPKMPRISKKEKKQMPEFQLQSAIQRCCRDNDLGRALEHYEEAVRRGVRVMAPVYYSLLALCDGVQRRAMHIGRPQYTPPEKQETKKDPSTALGSNETKKEFSLEDRKLHAFRIKAAMDEAKIPLSEAAFTSVIKLLARTGELDKANELLMESEKVQQCRPKLRLYNSLLEAYANAGRMMDAVRVWYQFSNQNLMASEKEYILLLRCAVKCQSPTLMETVLSDLAEDVPVPCRDTEQVIIEWFESAASADPEKYQSADKELLTWLEKIHASQNQVMRVAPPSMGPVQSHTGWVISRACRVNTLDGSLTDGCLRDIKLRPIEIAPELWKDMEKASQTIGSEGQLEEHTSAYRGGRKGSKNIPADKTAERKRHWQNFLRFLKKRKKPIDVVMDGANVGYSGQNYGNNSPGLQYDPIDWVVSALEKLGKSVLICMHSRHFKAGRVPAGKKAMVDAWMQRGLVYRTPFGMDDDTFWMHAALTRPGTLVLTNDQMRDHHFQMMAPRCFLRWRDRHQVYFEFGDFDSVTRRRQVIFKFPDPYTRRIQRVADGLVVPLPKRGDTNRFLDGCFEAEDDFPEDETYLCIRPK